MTTRERAPAAEVNAVTAMRWGVILLLTVILGLLRPPLGAGAPASSSRTEGTIAAVESGTLTVTARYGAQVRVALTAETVIILRRTVTLEGIRPNDFVGVTARRELDGSLTAISINIFPPEYKGRIRQAQFVMETGNIMTNATVFQNVRRVQGRTLYLKLGDGSVIITVPSDATVFRLTLATAAELRPGMIVIVRGAAAPDGGVTATTITVDVR